MKVINIKCSTEAVNVKYKRNMFEYGVSNKFKKKTILLEDLQYELT
jgi:hypothetical protein